MQKSDSRLTHANFRQGGRVKSGTKKVLVVGATGFVGKSVLEAMRTKRGYEVVAGCRRPSALPSWFVGQVRQVDLRDTSALPSLFAGIDTVCMCAAWSALYGHAQESRDYYLKPLLEAIAAAKRAGVRRFIFTSALNISSIAKSASLSVREDIEKVWPHIANTIRLEDALRAAASDDFEAASLRIGVFCGAGLNLGVLPVMLPRLRARLVPYIEGGSTPIPLVDGADIGRAFGAVVEAESLSSGLNLFDVVGGEVPTFKELFDFLHGEFAYPRPIFSVSFTAAFRAGALFEFLAKHLPFDPLLTRSIVFLSETVTADTASLKALGYRARVHWTDSVRAQVHELHRSSAPARLHDPTPASQLPARVDFTPPVAAES